MSSNRLEMLEQFLQEDPDDPFNLYAVALEYATVDPSKAKGLFTRLLDRHPDYVPTYYQAGNLFLNQGETERAISVWKTGMEKARSAGDFKAMGELQGMLSANE